MGRAHGAAYREEIRAYAAERIALVRSGRWSGERVLSRREVLDLANACIPAHEAYDAALMEEVQGLADATDLSLGELIVAGGFTDFVDTVYGAYGRTTPLEPQLAVDDCTAFIVPETAADGAGYFGQTWDMHDSAAEFVLLLEVRPSQGSRALVFTTTGCVGQIGMNEHGIAVGINNLLGADGRIGVTWPFVVRKMLQQDNLEDALAALTGAPLAGAHNFLLFDGRRGYNVEAMSTHHEITPLASQPIVHTNHCLLPATNALAQQRLPDSQASSEARLESAEALLEKRPVTIEHLQELTRRSPICVTSKPPFHVESCGAAIMRPATGDFWALWGLPSHNEFEHFSLASD